MRCEGLLDCLCRLGIVHVDMVGLSRHVGGHAWHCLHWARHEMALGTPVEARMATEVKGPSLRCSDATLHERVTTDCLWVDCLMSH